MVKNKKRLSQKDKEEDIVTYDGINSISDYNPTNQAYNKTNINAGHDEMISKQNIEKGLEDNLNTAVSNSIDAEDKFHKLMIGVRAQVIAQYGDDAKELELVGLKKKSDYKKRVRKPAKA